MRAALEQLRDRMQQREAAIEAVSACVCWVVVRWQDKHKGMEQSHPFLFHTLIHLSNRRGGAWRRWRTASSRPSASSSASRTSARYTALVP